MKSWEEKDKIKNKASSTPSIHPELREKLKEGKIEKVKMTIQELRALIKNHLFKKKRNNQ